MPLTEPHGLLASFASEDALVEAAGKVRQAGYERVEAFSPYPSPDTAKALGYHRAGVDFLVLMGGLSGAALGFFMLYWIEAYAWPLNVGGRPLNSWPMYFSVTVDLGVLTGGLAAFLGLLLLCRLPRYNYPLFSCQLFARHTVDGFYIFIEAADPKFHRQGTRDFLATLDPTGIEEVSGS